jgi:hypothetical protein
MMRTPLPEPVIAREECAINSDEYYTESQLRAYGQAIREETLEDAAKVCDEAANRTFSSQCAVWGDKFARDIREMKGQHE